MHIYMPPPSSIYDRLTANEKTRSPMSSTGNESFYGPILSPCLSTRRFFSGVKYDTVAVKRLIASAKKKFGKILILDPSELDKGLTLVLLCVVMCEDVGIESNVTENTHPENSPVEVTAVFINCDMDDLLKHPDNENSRFEREELFRHNALRNCDKKLTLTIKLSSASAKSADEYVPIDHVVDAGSKRRVRLLNPYVLRLRRDAPLEAYKLRFIETVQGMLATANEQTHKYRSGLWKRTVDTAEANSLSDWRTDPVATREPQRAGCALRLADEALASGLVIVPSPQARGHSVLAENHNISTKRAKRHEKNVIIEEAENFNKRQGNREYSLESRFSKATNNNEEVSRGINEVRNEMNNKAKGNFRHQPKTKLEQDDNIDVSGKEFALYEIENPMLWFNVHVHLFEKLTTLEGNTLWNDISKGVPVSLSSQSREWSGPDMTVHYRPVDLAREEYSLPQSSLCLLIPLLEEKMNTITGNMKYAFDDSNYILVPSEDVLDIEKIDKSKRTYSNVSAEDRHEETYLSTTLPLACLEITDFPNIDIFNATPLLCLGKQCRRKVVVRVARALSNFKGDKFNVVDQASDKFLTMRHRRIRHAQVDLEARADDNQLVHTSAPGRIATIVAENTRDKRTTLTVQATNTGLFASQFRIQLRECDSDLVRLSEKQGGSVVSDAVVLPPRHTRRLRLRLPAALAADLQHCSVYLLNGNDESVAVRDAVIKREDQCYCVWHCDCICYGDNPRLPCREMSAARQDAAGLPLPTRRAARFARACHYTDVTTVNVAVVVIGVIGMLLFFGLFKGLLGLVWTRAGVWGLDWVLEEPRQLDHYQEKELRGRDVVYDDKCWPVHPDTGQRTVRAVSLPVEFTLNVIFFVVAPGLITVDALKHLSKRTGVPTTASGNKTNLLKCKHKFNSRHDVQGRKRDARLPQSNWMSPGAEDLSAAIWATDATALVFNNSESLFPLLPDTRLKPELDPAQSSGSDSELEDTAFVLMHMQKSTESLAKNQMQPNIAGLSSDTGHKSHLQTTGKANFD